LSTRAAGNIPVALSHNITQFLLRFSKDDNNDLGADFLKIYSGNAAEAYRPQLIVEYYNP